MLRTTPRTFSPISTRVCHASTSSATRPSRRVPLRRLAIPLFLVSAVSSLAINVRNSRDTLEQLESSHSAQRSVLLDLVDRLEKGDQLSADQIKREFERVGIIQRQLQKRERSIGWKETIFGRRKTAEELAKEQEEIDQIEESIRRADETDIPGQTSAKPTRPALARPQDPPAMPTLSLPVRKETPSASTKNQGIFI